jgi:hypothetical protein
MGHATPRFRAAVASAAAVVALVLLATVAAPAARRAPKGRVAGGGPALLWPVEVTPAIVSTFGEYRYDHLHAGVDISTGGVSGRPVRAAADGAVYRLKVEWRGYGRALYLRHPGGRSTVYGHLKAFDEAGLGLESRVARRQAGAGTPYPGDIYLEPPIPVRRGQVIGISGESGVGLPHLHFEARGPADDPIDPFRAGLEPPPDEIPPALESIVVGAATPQTFIDGSWRARTIALRRPRAHPDARARVEVSGPFTAALTAWDPAGGGRAGLRKVAALLDGVPCYSLETPGFRFDQYPIAGLIFDHRLSHLGPTTMAWRLGQLPGNVFARQGCAAAGAPPGAFDPGPGTHRLEVIVTDAAGLERRAAVDVVVSPPGSRAPRTPPDGAARGAPRGAGRPADRPADTSTPQAEGRYHSAFAEFVIGVTGAAGPPALEACRAPEIGSWTTLDGGTLVGVTLDYDQAAALAAQAAAGRIAPACPLAAALAGAAIGVARPGQALHLEAAGARVDIPPGGRFFPGPLVLTRRTAAEVPAGLRSIGDAVDILPDGEALDARASLALPFDPGAGEAGRLGIYRFDPVVRRWTLEGDEVEAAARSVRCLFRRYGRFALLADEVPPRIISVRPAAGGVTGRRPEIAAHVTEVGKGLGWDGVVFVLDGARIPAEYDPDRGVARPFETPRLAPGQHRLSVSAIDRAGNPSETVAADFTVR